MIGFIFVLVIATVLIFASLILKQWKKKDIIENGTLQQMRFTGDVQIDEGGPLFQGEVERPVQLVVQPMEQTTTMQVDASLTPSQLEALQVGMLLPVWVKGDECLLDEAFDPLQQNH